MIVEPSTEKMPGVRRRRGEQARGAGEHERARLSTTGPSIAPGARQTVRPRRQLAALDHVGVGAPDRPRGGDRDASAASPARRRARRNARCRRDRLRGRAATVRRWSFVNGQPRPLQVSDDPRALRRVADDERAQPRVRRRRPPSWLDTTAPSRANGSARRSQFSSTVLPRISSAPGLDRRVGVVAVAGRGKPSRVAVEVDGCRGRRSSRRRRCRRSRARRGRSSPRRRCSRRRS